MGNKCALPHHVKTAGLPSAFRVDQFGRNA